MKTADYMQAAKDRAGLPSDYALAVRLGVTRQAVSNWKRGVNLPDPLAAYRLGDLAGIDPLIVIADVERERAERMSREQDADAWGVILKRLGGAAASVLLGTVLSAPPGAANASPSQGRTADSGANPLCIMSSRRRREAREQTRRAGAFSAAAAC